MTESIPNHHDALRLIDEAVGHAAKLGNPYEEDLAAEFAQARQTLGASAEARSQQALILAAARRLIDWAEKKTIRLIIGDEPITSQQMSHLVRIRLICAELINLLNRTLEQVRSAALQPARAA